MKLPAMTLLCLALASTAAQARPGAFGEEQFDLILGAVDADTAAALTVDRDNVEALRTDLDSLRESGADSDAIAAARDALRTARHALHEDVRSVVDDNSDLRAALHDAAATTREAHRMQREDQHEARMEEILGVATADQADTINAQHDTLTQPREEVRTARDAGASAEELGALQAEIREAHLAQRELIRDIVESNPDVLGDLADVRERARGQHPHRRGGFGG